jgi:hypothetical protein
MLISYPTFIQLHIISCIYHILAIKRALLLFIKFWSIYINISIHLIVALITFALHIKFYFFHIGVILLRNSQDMSISISFSDKKQNNKKLNS